VPGALSRIVKPVLGKLDRKTVKRTLMQARDETFHHLLGQKFQFGQILIPISIDVQRHGAKLGKPPTKKRPPLLGALRFFLTRFFKVDRPISE
jgi:hypothetical protein